MIFRIVKIFIVCFLLQVAMLFSQTPDQIEQLEQQLAKAQIQQDSLAVIINKMMVQSDSLSGLVSSLRQKQSLNIAERGQLDNLLKKSQLLSTQQEVAVFEHSQISQEIKNIKTELIGQYDFWETQIIEKLENSTQSKSQTKKELAKIRKRKTELARQESLNSSNIQFDLQIEPNDMPGDIEAKAILLRDRENTFRQKAQQLEKRHKAVKDETTLRIRMAEMVDDVRLFDTRDEALSSSNRLAAQATDAEKRYSGDDSESWFNPEDMGGISNSSDVAEANELLSFDFQSIPQYDVQDYLNDLDEHKKRLLREADSLSQIADEFETEADKLRNSLKKSPE